MKLKMVSGAAELQVSEATFGHKFNESLVHQVITAYRNAGRAGTKAQKSRAEVSGGGKKPWSQKGTGQARAGSNRSPIWVGGGKTFAAKPRSFEQKVNRKMYRGALCSMLAELNRQGRLKVVPEFAVDAPKTKALVGRLDQIEARGRTLIVTQSVDEKLFLAARNNPNIIDVIDVDGINPVALAAADHVVITVDAVKKVEEWLA